MGAMHTYSLLGSKSRMHPADGRSISWGSEEV